MNPSPLTREQIWAILDAVRDKHVFVARQLEVEGYEIPSYVVERWKQQGKIQNEIEEADFLVPNYSSGELIAHPFIFGRLWNAIEEGGAFEKILDKAIHAPLINTSLIAADILTQRLQKGQHLDQVTRSILEIGIRYHLNELQRANSSGEATSHRATTTQQLASELYHQIQAGLDWDKVAYDISHGVFILAQAIEILQKWGADALVYRSPMKTACHQCKLLYLEKDNTPKLFTVIGLLNAGCNKFRKKYPQTKSRITSLERKDGAETWKPVAGLTHPWCQCGAIHIFTGMEWWADDERLAQLNKNRQVY